jgi:glycosyltransferase involved in cell wall biosynthesis
MRVTHFNTFLDGGAATASRRLHSELVRTGVDSQYFYSSDQGEPLDLDGTYHRAKWERGNLGHQFAVAARYRLHRQAFKRVVRQRAAVHEVFTSPQGAPHTPWPPVGISADDQIIHLHWIAKFIDQASFFASLPPGQPVVWTLHDMNAFTGGCHFSEGCHRYQTGCGHCPQLPVPSNNDFSRHFFEEKARSIQGVNLHVVSPSKWLIESAESSRVFRGTGSFHHIPYGINTETYYPMDRREARARLGIDPDAMVVCFGAMDVNNTRKGARQLTEAFAAIADIPGVIGLVFGSGELPKTPLPLPPIHRVGPIAGTLQQRTVFSAADIFVLPSLEDNLPLTGLEAMACGTPIVGFDAGGIPDYVRAGVSGLVAKMGDSEDLGRQLRQLLTDRPTSAALGKSARMMIEQEYASHIEASRYQQLYQALIMPLTRSFAA